MRNYLKQARKIKNLSQFEVAELLNISESYYSLIENGSRQKDMNISLVQKLADIFGVSVEYILKKEQSKN